MKVTRVRDVKLPTRGTSQSAGIDFYVPNNYGEKSLGPGHKAFIPSGIKANVPPGHALIAFNKSGVALKKNLFVGACVVDEDYQGEIHLHLFNVGEETVKIDSGEKIVQFLLIPVKYPGVTVVPDKELFYSKTSRGAGGFGSTGV